MLNPGFIYLVAMVGIYAVVYLALRWFFLAFFRQAVPAARARVTRSLSLIAALAILIFALSLVIPSEMLANRFLHAIGGGFLAMFVCFLAARDSALAVTRFQFFALATLIVTALGVGNELMEFLLQAITGFPFTDSLIDTWLDLTSNTAGIILGIFCLLPFVKSRD